MHLEAGIGESIAEDGGSMAGDVMRWLRKEFLMFVDFVAIIAK